MMFIDLLILLSGSVIDYILTNSWGPSLVKSVG